MCNLYSVTKSHEAVRNLFRVSHNRASPFEAMPAIFPGWQAPVVRKAADGERELVRLSWGFVLLQDGRAPRRVTNTRDDKMTSRFWKASLATRRCLIPATAFCEPHDGRKPATWHWFALRDEVDSRPLFAFAGLWQRWQGPVKKDGPNVDIDVYSFMTTEPNSATASINHERSPLLLTTDAARDTWLDGSLAEASALVRPIDGGRLHIVQEGFDKEDRLGAPLASPIPAITPDLFGG